MKLIFEWDTAKAASNFKKHRVSFECATRVFADPFALVEQDCIVNGDCRFRTLGIADDGYLLLFVSHTVRDDESGIEVIRIISARRADKTERKRYEQNGTP